MKTKTIFLSINVVIILIIAITTMTLFYSTNKNSELKMVLEQHAKTIDFRSIRKTESRLIWRDMVASVQSGDVALYEKTLDRIQALIQQFEENRDLFPDLEGQEVTTDKFLHDLHEIHQRLSNNLNKFKAQYPNLDRDKFREHLVLGASDDLGHNWMAVTGSQNIYLQQNLIDFHEENKAFQTTTYIIIFTSSLLLFLISCYFYFFLSKPISRLTLNADNLERVKQTFRTNSLEIKTLVNKLVSNQTESNETISRISEKLSLTNQEIEAQQRQHEAEQLAFSYINHELRTPLSLLTNTIDRIEELNDSEHLIGLINECKSNARLLLALTTNVIDFNKASHSPFTLNKATFSLQEFIADVSNQVKSSIASEKIFLSFYVSRNVPLNLFHDRSRLNQILINLLFNAIKFTEKGSIEVEIDYVEERLTFTVLDTGPGFDDAHLSQEQRDFVQHTATNDKYASSGLGLSIVNSLAELMDGRLVIANRPILGAACTLDIPYSSDEEDKFNPVWPFELSDCAFDIENFYLQDYLSKQFGIDVGNTHQGSAAYLFTDKPLVTVETCPSTRVFAFGYSSSNGRPRGASHIELPLNPVSFLHSKTEVSEDSLTAMSTPSNYDVLVVEDVEMNRKFISKVLDKLSLNYHFSHNGLDAFDFFVTTEAKPRFIFIDIDLPVLNGIETTKAIRTLSKSDDVVIVGLSGNIMKSKVDQGLEAGMDEYLVKPLIYSKVKSLIEKYG